MVGQGTAQRIAERVDAYVDPDEIRNPRVMKARDLCEMQKETAAQNVLAAAA